MPAMLFQSFKEKLGNACFAIAGVFIKFGGAFPKDVALGKLSDMWVPTRT